jgi:MarR family transcriptional regulator, lower aerobic nicotinate degradation pathway regulator
VGNANGRAYSGAVATPTTPSEPDDDEPPARFWTLPSWLTNRAALVSSRYVVAQLASVGSRRHEFNVLTALAEAGPLSQASLGRRCGLDPSDTVAVLADLEGRGLIRRDRDPNDRRRNAVDLTPEGEAFRRTLESVLAEAQAAYMAPLDADEREQLVTLLTKLLRGHDLRPGGAAKA